MKKWRNERKAAANFIERVEDLLLVLGDNDLRVSPNPPPGASTAVVEGRGGYRGDTSLLKSSSEGPNSCACSDQAKHSDRLVQGSRPSLSVASC